MRDKWAALAGWVVHYKQVKNNRSDELCLLIWSGTHNKRTYTHIHIISEYTAACFSVSLSGSQEKHEALETGFTKGKVQGDTDERRETNNEKKRKETQPQAHHKGKSIWFHHRVFKNDHISSKKKKNTYFMHFINIWSPTHDTREFNIAATK